MPTARDDRPSPALTKIEVTGLFGHFDHTIAFPPNWDFVIIHGVNGVGKTKVLDLVQSLLSGSLMSLCEVPFREARLTFEDNSELHSVRERVHDGQKGRPASHRPPVTLHINYSRPRRKPVSYVFNSTAFRSDSRLRQEIEHFTRLTPIDEDTFFDPATGETVTLFDLLDHFGHPLPSRRMLMAGAEPPPPALRQLWADSNVHLIETQRLLRDAPPEPRRGTTRPWQKQSTVMRFSEDVVDRIQRALSDLARRSQELDKTFPSRLVRTAAVTEGQAASESAVRARYDQQVTLRRRLGGISVLDAFGPDIRLPRETLPPAVLQVMAEFLNDSEEKFKVVEPLLDRLELLTEVLNSKYQYKQLEIDRSSGFRIRTDEGDELPPDRLSSGEQHELVLLYDLLFEAKSRALVLIDEPEISLHVSWQAHFLSDLRRIGTLTQHRFIVATHSPQVVGRFTDRMVKLDRH